MAFSEKQAQLNRIMGSRLRDMTARQIREIITILTPVVLLIGAAIYVALQFIEPAPPKKVVMSTGAPTGAYYRIGLSYAAALKRNGIELEVRNSEGSVENFARLTDASAGVDIALVQGGISNATQSPGLVSIGRMFSEPLWVFYRGSETINKLGQLKGKRIAVGSERSGTGNLARLLLTSNRVTPDNAQFLPITGQAAVDALLRGDADAIFLALAPEAPILRSLLDNPEARLVSFAQAEAYTRLYPFLQRIVLPQGAIDLVRNVPEVDVELVAPVAAMVTRKDLHPAVIGLLAEAAREIHGNGGLFNRVGEFPRSVDPEFEMAPEAVRMLKDGPTWLRRSLPFWLAAFIERTALIAVPLAGVLLPLGKAAPAVYRWRVRRRLFYWYGRLKALEALIAENSLRNLDEYRAELSRIDEAVTTIPVPVGFVDQYYNLRAAVDLVRQRLQNETVAAQSATG